MASASPTNIPSGMHNELGNSVPHPHRLERSMSHQLNSSMGRDHTIDSPSSGIRRPGMNANPSWDDDNLPEW